MEQQDTVVTAPRGGLRDFLKSLSGPGMARKRKILYLVFTAIPMISFLLLMFVPICTFVDPLTAQQHIVSAAGAMASLEAAGTVLGSFAYIQLALLAVLLASILIVVYKTLRNLISWSEEEAMAKRTRGAVTFGVVVTALYSVICFLFSPINVSLGGGSTSAFNPIPLILMMVVAVAYAVFAGAVNLSRQQMDENVFEKKERERRQRRQRSLRARKIELLVYAVLNAVLALVALMSEFMRVKFDSLNATSIPDYTLSGADLLFVVNPQTLSPGERTVAFFVFALAVVMLAVAFLAVISFFSRSVFYGKIAVGGVVLGGGVCLLVGLFGQYYSIVQELNVEVITRLLEARFGASRFLESMLEEVTYQVTSSSMLFFLFSLVIIAVLFFRRPYSKILAMENEIAAEDAAKLPQMVELLSKQAEEQSAADPVEDGAQPTDEAITRDEDSTEAEASVDGEGEDAVTESQAPVYVPFDPCPAFTELDSKIPLYQSTLETKREALYKDPTLPHLVDFIVQYARDSRHHLFYTPEHIAAFLAGMGTTRLSILQGMSGTGKTSLPKIVAEALMSVCDIVEVESSWRDKNELLGYYNEFNKIYTPKKFTQALYRAKLNPETLTFIVLDEMNLSRIEYYFSDFLSLMENEPDKRELKLLNVPLRRIEAENGPVDFVGLEEGHTLKIPANVWFIGTANRDESTYDISDKVYDRAHTMNFDKRAAKVQYYNEPIPARYVTADQLNDMFENAKNTVKFSLDQYPVIAEVERLLEPYNISFGNRVALQMESFVSIYTSCFTANDAIIHDALETILLSKVVRKLELKSVEDKDSLADEFAKLRLMRCSTFIRGLKED